MATEENARRYAENSARATNTPQVIWETSKRGCWTYRSLYWAQNNLPGVQYQVIQPPSDPPLHPSLLYYIDGLDHNEEVL
jgi:hypothetical protein